MNSVLEIRKAVIYAMSILIALGILFFGIALSGCSTNNQQQETKTEEQAAASSEEGQAEEQQEAKEEEKADEPDLSEWIFYDSDSRYLDDDDLKGLSESELRLARNEIFARHGRGFSSDDLQEYFNSKSWYEKKYSPDEFDAKHSGDLNKYEKKNVDFISSYEAPKNNYFTESGVYIGYVEEISKVTISGDTMMIKGRIAIDGGRSLKSATRYFKLGENCEYSYDWGGGSGNDKKDVTKDLKNLSFEIVTFEIYRGEVVYLQTGAG